LEGQREKLWTKDFVLLTICNLLLFMNLQMMTPAFPAYVSGRFHANDFTVSLVISLFALSAIVARLFSGEALKRGKRNQILIAGLCLALLSSAGYFWSGTIAMLLVMRILFGAGFGMVSTTFPTMTSNIVPPKRMGEGMGYFGLSTSLAMSIAPVIGLGLLGEYGFGTLVAVATVLILLIFPLIRLVRSSGTQPAKKMAASHHAPKVQFFDRAILLPCFLNLLLSITYGGLISFIALFGAEANLANPGWFFLCNAIAILLVRPISGKIFDKKGHIAVLIPGALLVLAGLLILSYTTTMNVLMISAAFYGLGYGILQPSIQAWIINLVTPEKRGMANAAFLNSIDLGIALGSMLLGVIATATSYPTMYRMSALLMAFFLFIYFLYLAGQAKRRKAYIAGKELGA
jgi:MFS family permease